MRHTDQAHRTAALAVFIAGLACAPAAHAYLDPGTGSILLQSILAGIAVAIGVLRLYWYRFKSFFAHLTSPGQEDKCEELQESAPEPDARNKP